MTLVLIVTFLLLVYMVGALFLAFALDANINVEDPRGRDRSRW